MAEHGTRPARLAGSHAAMVPAATIGSGATANVTGSAGVMLNRIPSIARARTVIVDYLSR
jgi:hypothetical protein